MRELLLDAGNWEQRCLSAGALYWWSGISLRDVFLWCKVDSTWKEGEESSHLSAALSRAMQYVRTLVSVDKWEPKTSSIHFTSLDLGWVFSRLYLRVVVQSEGSDCSCSGPFISLHDGHNPVCLHWARQSHPIAEKHAFRMIGACVCVCVCWPVQGVFLPFAQFSDLGSCFKDKEQLIYINGFFIQLNTTIYFHSNH